MFQSAVLLRSLSFADASAQRLAVMDGTAFTLAAENGIDCVVFNMRSPGNVERALLGDPGVGTSISSSHSSSSSSSSAAAGGAAEEEKNASSSSSSPSSSARELLRAPTVTKGVAWRGGVGAKSDSDEGPSVGC